MTWRDGIGGEEREVWRRGIWWWFKADHTVVDFQVVLCKNTSTKQEI